MRLDLPGTSTDSTDEICIQCDQHNEGHKAVEGTTDPSVCLNPFILQGESSTGIISQHLGHEQMGDVIRQTKRSCAQDDYPGLFHSAIVSYFQRPSNCDCPIYCHCEDHDDAKLNRGKSNVSENDAVHA